MTFKTTFVWFADLMIVFSAILSTIKFVLLRDAASLKAIAGMAGVSFIAVALYLNFLAPVVSRVVARG